MADTAQQIAARLQRLADRMPNEVARALYQEMEIEATESKRRTPVDTGALRSSIHVDEPIVKGRDISVSMVAGGPAAPYAVQVHEDLDAYHPVGQAKFIESTLNEARPFLAQRIAKRIELSRLIS